MSSSLTPVPENISAVTALEPILRRVVAAVYDGMPFQSDMRLVEDYLRDRRALLQSGALDASYDWLEDINRAEMHYKTAIDWLPHHRDIRENYLKYWRERTDKTAQTLTAVSLNGLKTVMLLHGAVALGALNILSDKDSAASNLFVAKFALAFALIGIMTLGLGQIITIKAMTDLNGNITNKIYTTIPWKKVRALSRYWRRGYRPLYWADYLIYASVFWFGAYAAILCIMLAGN